MSTEAQRKASLAYYYKNREKILAQRRERYHNDILYKQSVYENIKKSYDKKAEKKRLEKDYRKFKKKYWKVFKINGEPIEFCRITLLAKQIKRSQQTIRVWEKNGLLPKALKVRNMRYYSEYQYNLILKMWNLYGENDLYRFFNEVRKNWRLKDGNKE